MTTPPPSADPTLVIGSISYTTRTTHAAWRYRNPGGRWELSAPLCRPDGMRMHQHYPSATEPTCTACRRLLATEQAKRSEKENFDE